MNQQTIPCPACQNNISQLAWRCPDCGHPIRRSVAWNIFKKSIGILLVIGLFIIAGWIWHEKEKGLVEALGGTELPDLTIPHKK